MRAGGLSQAMAALRDQRGLPGVDAHAARLQPCESGYVFVQRATHPGNLFAFLAGTAVAIMHAWPLLQQVFSQSCSLP